MGRGKNGLLPICPVPVRVTPSWGGGDQSPESCGASRLPSSGSLTVRAAEIWTPPAWALHSKLLASDDSTSFLYFPLVPRIGAVSYYYISVPFLLFQPVNTCKMSLQGIPFSWPDPDLHGKARQSVGGGEEPEFLDRARCATRWRIR